MTVPRKTTEEPTLNLLGEIFMFLFLQMVRSFFSLSSSCLMLPADVRISSTFFLYPSSLQMEGSVC